MVLADGHHRAASAVKVGLKRRAEHPDYDGTEEFNFFLSVLFPDSELEILPYNRVVKDWNGRSFADLLQVLNTLGKVEPSDTPVQPEEKGTVGIYVRDQWYRFTFADNLRNDDPVEGLDVSLLQKHVLAPFFAIDDPRTSDRIDFVGGIRGYDELKKRCNEDCKVAFGMYPTSIHELFDVADAHLLMPPKSTWFEPKLRSGLFIHSIKKGE
jgi:uncharacterized protein (DUF1015 family)